LKSDLGAGSDEDIIEDDDEGWRTGDGSSSESDAAGLGGRDDCINLSRVSMHSNTRLLSVRVTFLRESITLSRAVSSLTLATLVVGEEWVEPALDTELGLGVSLTTGIMAASILGLRLVITLETAMREADQVARPKWE